MKTNVVMIRDDERFLQRTKDGYFDASALINSLESTKKSTRHYKSRKSAKEFIEQLQKEGVEKPYVSSNKGVWMHPKLFIDFAMYVSVEFKSTVIDYVLDGLINSRNEAGDYYNEMCATVMDEYIKRHGCKPPATLYIDEARMIKNICNVSNRNEASEEDLNVVTTLQKLNVELIKEGVYKKGREKQLKRLYKALI
tara:strand:- start:4582 stop:5169 length:588 start_codon:yes stop_codon:yes gene_type:complete